MRTLLLGGARSGKSRHAEQLARASGLPVTYVATAQAGDAEMARRIAQHQAARPSHWASCETPIALADTLQQLDHPGHCVLVDCLTLWLSNLLFAGEAARQAEAGEPIDCPLLQRETGALLAAISQFSGTLLLVSNEVGWGIVPMHPVARCFADEQGRLNQRVAAACDRVFLLAAGLPLALK